jgi:uncharacterized membrane protein
MILQIVTFVILTLGLTIYNVQIFLYKKELKAALLYGGLMGICMIVGSLIFAKVDIPSTTIPVRTIFEPIGKMILKQ